MLDLVLKSGFFAKETWKKKKKKKKKFTKTLTKFLKEWILLKSIFNKIKMVFDCSKMNAKPVTTKKKKKKLFAQWK